MQAAKIWLALSLTVVLCGVIQGQNTRLSQKPHVIFVIGESEYKSEQTLPAIARELEEKYGMRCTILLDKNIKDAWKPMVNERINDLPGLEALVTADLAVFYLRFRQLPEAQLKLIQAYLDAGKPVVGFRTSTHAFNYAEGDPLRRWNSFGAEVLGAPWIYHYGHTSSTDVSIIPAAAEHPILKGLDREFHVRSWLYHIRPDYPPKEAQWLLMGKSVGPSDRQERVDNPVAWTYRTKAGGRVFMTTMGHPEDFAVENFRRLVINAVHWALGKQ
jgi:type 1 glutamine amidotransferase